MRLVPTRPSFLARLGVAALALLGPTGGVWATAPAACGDAIARAERKYGTPTGLLSAIARVESGFAPYVLNIDGEAVHPRDADDALIRIRDGMRRGGLVDVGCMQVNMHYHGTRLPPLQALDPERNVDYAARFLTDLYRDHGSWSGAVAHYHSSRPDAQARYLAKVRESLGPTGAADLVAPGPYRAASRPAAPQRTVMLRSMVIERSVGGYVFSGRPAPPPAKE